MFSGAASKFLIPPVVVIAGWIVAFIAAAAGRASFLAVHFPLEVTLCASLVACVYVAGRLYRSRADAQLRVAFIANIIAIVAFCAFMLVFGFVAGPNI